MARPSRRAVRDTALIAVGFGCIATAGVGVLDPGWYLPLQLTGAACIAVAMWLASMHAADARTRHLSARIGLVIDAIGDGDDRTVEALRQVEGAVQEMDLATHRTAARAEDQRDEHERAVQAWRQRNAVVLFQPTGEAEQEGAG